MTETTIDEILSLLRGQKQSLELTTAGMKREIDSIETQLWRVQGRLVEIDYLIKYIEEDDHD